MSLEWLAAIIIPVFYIIVSIFFLCFPNILHKKKMYQYSPFNQLTSSNKLMCIGHRAGGWEAPQNTLQAMKKNSHLMHMFELDTSLTKDKQLVIHHDSSLERLCGVEELVSDVNYEDLPRYSKTLEAFGSQSIGGLTIETQRNKIPLLEDVFKLYPEKPMNIELKTPTDQAIVEYNRLIKKYNRQHITIWGVAGSKTDKLIETNPQIVHFYSAGEILKIYFLFLFGLLPFVCLRQGVMDIPLVSDSLYKMVMNLTSGSCLKTCLGWLAYQILNCFNFWSRLWIPHLKKRGILTFYFILNEEDDFDNAVATGCSGIMTDVPTRLNKYLKGRNLYFEEETDSF